MAGAGCARSMSGPRVDMPPGALLEISQKVVQAASRQLLVIQVRTSVGENRSCWPMRKLGMFSFA